MKMQSVNGTSTCTIVITTKDRKDDLRKALESVFAQTIAAEVLVIDDGSEDGTASMVKHEFPSVKLVRSEVSRGLIYQRNYGATLASGDIIFSIDDDAIFSSPDIIEMTLKDFDDPRIGAVGIPFINVRYSNAVLQRAPTTEGIFVIQSFAGCAHALKRSLFLQLGGYKSFLVRQGEEEDYCIRMLDYGFATRAGRAQPILHYHSPKRNHYHVNLYAARNRVLFIWYNAPFRYLLPALVLVSLGALRNAAQIGMPWAWIKGLLLGYGHCITRLFERRPVKAATFRRYLMLRKAHLVSIGDIEEAI